MTISHLVRFTFLAYALGAAACTDDTELDTPRSSVPAPLRGEWFTGTLSTIQYYDRDTGVFQNPSGSGFYFIFYPDGDYETGAVIDSTVAGCTKRLLGNEFGTLTVDGNDLTVYRAQITVSITDTCGHDGVRTQGAETRHLTWSVAPDGAGLWWLSLTHDDGSVERYRRWTR